MKGDCLNGQTDLHLSKCKEKRNNLARKSVIWIVKRVCQIL